ncbi:MAG: HAD family hydrolase [Treponema sp.]|jgi:FMN phosphatase YigB (HAD superfamily)|nr:HAD family hydrolase [Treponema sp.]
MRAFPARVNKVYLDDVTLGNTAAAAHYSAGGSIENFSGHHSLSKLLDNIKGIIFDFDGTLFDNTLLPFYLVAGRPWEWRRILKERLIRKRFAGCDYASAEEYYRAFFTALGKACFRSPQRIRNWYLNHYMPRMARVLKKHYQYRPGLQDLFCQFETVNAPRIAVYSDYPFLKGRMEALGSHFGPRVLLYGPESFGAQKPAVRPFYQIAAALDAAPEEVLVIGDREATDGLGAFRAGMHFFCLETGRRRYFRLDPYRRHPKNEEPQGPSLVMYAGVWDDLVKLLMKRG